MSAFPDLSDLDAWRLSNARNLAAFLEHVPQAMGLRYERWEDAWAADLVPMEEYPAGGGGPEPL